MYKASWIDISDALVGNVVSSNSVRLSIQLLKDFGYDGTKLAFALELLTDFLVTWTLGSSGAKLHAKSHDTSPSDIVVLLPLAVKSLSSTAASRISADFSGISWTGCTSPPPIGLVLLLAGCSRICSLFEHVVLACSCTQKETEKSARRFHRRVRNHLLLRPPNRRSWRLTFVCVFVHLSVTLTP